MPLHGAGDVKLDYCCENAAIGCERVPRLGETDPTQSHCVALDEGETDTWLK